MCSYGGPGQESGRGRGRSHVSWSLKEAKHSDGQRGQDTGVGEGVMFQVKEAALGTTRKWGSPEHLWSIEKMGVW